MNQVEFWESNQEGFWEMNFEPGNEECKHPLPGDWIFGGPTDEDPRADPRWRPVTYVYLDRMLRRRHITQEPFCSHVAIGSYLERQNGRLGQKHFYVTAAPEGRDAVTIYADTDGALGGSN